MTSVPVPFNDLMRGTDSIRAELDAAISRVVSSGWFVLGPEHDAFESELAAYVGTAHAINVGNGTDALELGLAALGRKALDRCSEPVAGDDRQDHPPQRDA